jgi:hypothetical protein
MSNMHFMNHRVIIRLTLAGALGVAIASPAHAQSTLGGVKPQQNKIGGVAKPPPVVGGATIHTPSPPTPPKPGPVVNLAKPGPTVTPTPNAGTTGPRPNAAVMTPFPDKDGKVANLKCVSGACMSKGPKP